MRGAEQDREFGRRVHELLCAFEISACPVQEDVVPDACSSGEARDPAQRLLEQDDNHDRQSCPVSAAIWSAARMAASPSDVPS